MESTFNFALDQWRIQGKGLEGPAPPPPTPTATLILRPNWGPKDWKKIFWRPVPLLSQGLDGCPRPNPPAFFLRSESATVDCSAFLIFSCRYRLVREIKGDDKLFFFLFGRFVGFFFKRTENTRSNDHFVFFLLKETGNKWLATGVSIKKTLH